MPTTADLEKYADLIVRTAVHIQRGQVLWINAPIHTPDLVRLIVKRAYEEGAKRVHVEWQDEQLTKLTYGLAPDEAFEQYPAWRAQAMNELAEQGGAYLFIKSDDPELLKDINPKRLSDYSRVSSAALATFRKYMSSKRMTWSIVAAPSDNWAKLVFPALDTHAAVEALWEAIFRAVRVKLDDPVHAWAEHNSFLLAKRAYLDAKQYKKLHYRAPGTDLVIELPDNHLWNGGISKNEQGNTFNPNVPTEEVYTAPHRNGTHGVVRSTKPLSYQGNLIENFSLTFADGRVVDFQAEKGYESLKAMLDLDEHSRYLGEAALVPHRSPISDSNIIFFNTLFDENASNHLALGNAYPTCVQGGAAMTREELEQAGLNQSILHVDFMIGSAEMDIDGITRDGKAEPVFRKGNWAF
ncbi:peptidase M29 aminopeptidase II [Paenibacillus curdlanolyticus YK9]|uniref:Peptidase M29 aminopeptidase II n=1 Tax=Paenibacillus curdlanolyticus YK9 TaxID=717606 RepID=E0IAC1_9BACL|nr:aminopeptidase [Paenibacillus curdlanolyticus]EFM10698.1 peptidase M29 aminopeptidase II [Paenibacillus curdlanolyticus YK9]